MVWFSHHGGHSGQFCKHAQNTLREVVDQAVALGFTSFGLSEHCPRFRQQDLYEEERPLTPADLEAHFRAYIVEARELQAEYADRIELLVGFETEALPEDNWHRAMAAISAQHDFDFCVGSVHSVNGTFIDYKPELNQRLMEQLGGWEPLCIAYFDEVARLVEAIRPSVVGHLDLIRRFEGDSFSFSQRVWPSIKRALEAVRISGSLLELNAAPARKVFGPVYPAADILKLAKSMDIPITLSDDSHGVSSVGGGLNACLSLAAAAGYRELFYLTRHPQPSSRPSPYNARVFSTPVAMSDVKPRLPA